MVLPKQRKDEPSLVVVEHPCSPPLLTPHSFRELGAWPCSPESGDGLSEKESFEGKNGIFEESFGIFYFN